MAYLFRDRAAAGHQLAKALQSYDRKENTLVLALPRGGVPVAHEVAKSLSLPMDIWLVRKLGVPGHEELAMGALAAGNTCYLLDTRLIHSLGIPAYAVEEVIAKETMELQRRETLYRKGRPPPQVAGKTIIVIDDGLATGASMRAAIESLQHAKAGHIVVAAPVGAAETCSMLASIADEVICPEKPAPFSGVGQWYQDFSEVSDQEVTRLLPLAASI